MTSFDSFPCAYHILSWQMILFLKTKICGLRSFRCHTLHFVISFKRAESTHFRFRFQLFRFSLSTMGTFHCLLHLIPLTAAIYFRWAKLNFIGQNLSLLHYEVYDFVNEFSLQVFPQKNKAGLTSIWTKSEVDSQLKESCINNLIWPSCAPVFSSFRVGLLIYKEAAPNPLGQWARESVW